jgi:hypothetical protein
MDLTLDYHTLPPGLHRRLCYSYSLRHPVIQVNLSDEFTYEFLSNLEPVRVGVNSTDLVLHTKVKLNDSEDTFCTICQDRVKLRFLLRELKCKCVFHINCVERLSKLYTICPNCRSDIM